MNKPFKLFIVKKNTNGKLIPADKNLSDAIIINNSYVADPDQKLLQASVVFQPDNGTETSYDGSIFFHQDKVEEFYYQIAYFRAFQKERDLSASHFIAFLEEYWDWTDTEPGNTLYRNAAKIEIGEVFYSYDDRNKAIFREFLCSLSSNFFSHAEKIYDMAREGWSPSEISETHDYIEFYWEENGERRYSYAKIPKKIEYNEDEDVEKNENLS